MKQGKPLITLVMVIFAAVLCIYFGFYVFDTFNDPYSTTHTYQYTHSESAQANGVLVRAEQVLPIQGGIVELQCGEGEKVGARQTVAYVYQDAQAQRDSAALEALAAEIAVLESALTSGAGVDSAAQMDENVLQAVVELRAGVARQDFPIFPNPSGMMIKKNLKKGCPPFSISTNRRLSTPQKTTVLESVFCSVFWWKKM